MLPLCKEERIGVIPYSPLAGGRLARDWQETTHRSELRKLNTMRLQIPID